MGDREGEWSDTRSVIDRLRTERDDWKRQWESACDDLAMLKGCPVGDGGLQAEGSEDLRSFARFCAQLPDYLGHPDAMVRASAIASRARRALNWSEVSDA